MIMALSLLIIAFIYGKLANYPYFLESLSSMTETAFIKPEFAS